MKKPKISITAAICMVLVCAMVAGCVAAGPTTGNQIQQVPTSTTQPSVGPTITGPVPTTLEIPPTEPDDADRYMVTVQKTDETYGVYDETMTLVFNENGDLLEYQVGHRRFLHTYDDQRNLICRKTYNSKGELVAQTDYTYDAAGRLAKTEGFGYNEVYTTYLTQYVYDDNGNMIHQKDYQNGELFTETVYDAKGNLLEGSTYYGGGYDNHTVYTYTADGKLQRSETERGGEPYSGWAYFYDASGHLIREERYILSKGVRKELTNTYTYDENGRCVRYDMGGFQGEQSYETYTYDAAGNMLSSVYNHYDGSSTAYYWTYDENGRMTSWESTNTQGTTAYTWSYDEQGNVRAFVQGTVTYTFGYSWPEAQLPQQAWELIADRIAAFTCVSVYTPEIYARIYN